MSTYKMKLQHKTNQEDVLFISFNVFLASRLASYISLIGNSLKAKDCPINPKDNNNSSSSFFTLYIENIFLYKSITYIELAIY